MTAHPSLPVLECRPIGVVRSPLKERGEAPHQPSAGAELRATIELLPSHNFEHALEDLEEWPFIWVLFWFHQNTGWRPKVLPPRSTRRRGVFATRSPHRPNPIGLSVVRLHQIEGLTLHVSGVDMLEGTPVLDIKPYVTHVDVVDGAHAGWLHNDPVPEYRVGFTPAALETMNYLSSTWGVDLKPHLEQALRYRPEPRPYRRIRKTDSGFVIALKDWRAEFHVSGSDVCVTRISSGYASRELADTSRPELEAHRALMARAE